MSGYLLDTSVTSMFAPGRPSVRPEVAEWMRRHNRRLHLSAITIFEATQGIAKLERLRAAKRARELTGWLDTLIASFDPRVLDVDHNVAHSAGALADHAIAIGRHPGAADILIAATARVHNLTLLTGNLRHFAPLGIDVVDPLVSLPD